jgi:hypothetical protein
VEYQTFKLCVKIVNVKNVLAMSLVLQMDVNALATVSVARKMAAAMELNYEKGKTI